MSVVHVNEANFETEVLRSELPVLVELHASWSAPSKQIAPSIEALALETDGRLRVVKVDVEAAPRVAQSFRAQSVPTLVLIAGGQIVNQHSGALDLPGLRRFVEPALPRSQSEVSAAELGALMQQGRVAPVDIRDAGSFARYRIPGAQNIPITEVRTRLAELAPRDGRLRVLYGRDDLASKALVTELEQQGLQVAYLAGGFLHWEADGLPVEKG